MSKFKMHCAMLHADSDYRFSEEFKVIITIVLILYEYHP